MITFTKSYKTADGQVFGTIEEAQLHELEVALDKTNGSSPAGVAKIVLDKKDIIIDILTMTPSSKPKARAIHGGSKPRKQKVTPIATPAGIPDSVNPVVERVMFDPATFFEMEEKPKVSDHGLWPERYRPEKFEDFIGSESVKETLKLWLEKKDIPHILFYSSPGTGKTALGKMLTDLIPCDSLIINASDENGVDDIRNKVQEFCMTMGVRPLKIMFLDEADRLTPDAQGILRNLMETYSQSTRFILTCNYKDKITPAIWSRCQTFEIKPPSKPEVMKHLVGILDREKVTYKKEDVAFIVNSYFPDMRKIINFAQQSSISGELKIAKASAADNDYKMKLLELLKTSNKAGVFTEIRQLVADASFSNYEEVYKFLFDKVNDYAPNKQAAVILHLADAVYQSALVFEREITFVAAMHKLLTVLNGR